VQFREVAVDLEIRDRLALVVNRSNSGVAASDVEKVVGFAAMARIRSAGMLFIHAANSHRSAVEAFPKAKVIGDIESLADRLIATRDEPGRTERYPRWLMRPVRDLLDRLTSQSAAWPAEPVHAR
jgi:Flp pilus assembly CpaE family ATPase